MLLERRRSPEFIVSVDDSADEGEDGEGGDLEVAVEVDDWVVGEEGGAKIDVPDHFENIFLKNYTT